MSRVVVVGAGMGGLAVAARLAATGHDVLVLEQAATVGGKVATYSRDGWTFDTGPSLLTMPHVYRELFEATGARLQDCVDLIRLDTACRYRFPDGTWLDVPGDRAAVPAALDRALGGGAGEQWDALIGRAEAIWRATSGPFLESAPSAADLVRLSRRLRDVRTVAPWSNLRGLGARYLRDPRLRMLLDRYATYTGSDPRLAPAALATVPYVEQEFGSWHVRGGLRRLADAVHARALTCGATVRTRTAVAAIEIDRGRVVGVRLDGGQRVAADLVVANADAATVYRTMLPSAVQGRAARRLARATPSLSGFVLLLALRGRTRDGAHHTVLFPDDYDDEFDSLFGRPRPVPSPAVYVCSPPDAALRPESGESWFVLVNAPRHDPGRGVDWTDPDLVRRYAHRILDVMAERGLDVRGRLAWARSSTPADLQRSTRSPGGSIYGTASNGASAAFLRPANRSPVPGLYLVGGSAHPGGGLPLVAMSARIVATMIGPAGRG